MVAFRWMVLGWLLTAGTACAGGAVLPGLPESGEVSLLATSTAMTLPTSTIFVTATPISAVDATASALPGTPHAYPPPVDPQAYPPPVLEPPPPTAYPPGYTWVPATPPPPTPTREPVSMTAALPLDWMWFYEQDMTGGEACGWSLFARSASGEIVQLADRMMTFLPREQSTPLLILCDGSNREEARLVDFSAGTSLPLQSDPARAHAYTNALLSPDETKIAIEGAGRDPDNPHAPGYPPPGFWGILVIDVASGEISEFIEFPPYEPGGVGWDDYFLLEWRADGFYYGTRASGGTQGWRATWPAGAAAPYRVEAGTLTVERSGPSSGFSLYPTPGGEYDASIPPEFGSPRAIYRPAP